MARFKSVSMREQVERKYPWRVDLFVPPNGFGEHLVEMYATTTHPVHTFSLPKREGESKHGAIRFYFPVETEARSFHAKWGGTLNPRPANPSPR